MFVQVAVTTSPIMYSSTPFAPPPSLMLILPTVNTGNSLSTDSSSVPSVGELAFAALSVAVTNTFLVVASTMFVDPSVDVVMV